MNQKQAAAKVTVDRLHKRNEIIARIEKLKIRIPIAKYIAAQTEHRRLREERAEARERENELKERDAPLKERVQNYKARQEARDRQCEKASESLAKTMAKVKECEDKSVKHEEEALAREGEVMRINKMVGKRKKDLQAKEEEIAKLKNTLRHNQRNFERLGPDESDEINVCNIVVEC